ncbi:MAG: oligosaccharide flippase family protein [Acidobacteriota bacterium]
MVQPEHPAASAGRRPKMFWDLSSLASGQLLSALLGFVGFAYLARTLTPETYGSVEYVVGVAALAAIVIEGGMGPLGTLVISRDPARVAELAGRIPIARLLVALVVVPLVGLSSHLAGFSSNVTMLTWWFALSLLAIPFKQDWLLQGLERMTYVAPAQVLKSAGFAIGVLLAIHGPGDLVRVGQVEALAAFLGALYFIVVQRALSIPLALEGRLASTWALMRDGAAIGASNMLWPFMVHAPILLVTNLSGSAEAAWLGGAQRIVVAFVSFSALYFFNLYPLIARGLTEDRSRWGRLMDSSFRVIAWGSIGIALVTTLVAEVIVTAVFGDLFRVAGPVLSIYIWILPLRLLSGHARWTLLAAERQRLLLLVELGCAATIVALALALVPLYGAAGAAVAGVLGNIAGWCLAHRAAERHAGSLPGARQVLLPMTAAVLAATVAWFADTSHPLRLALAIGTYALSMWLAAPALVADAIRLAHAKQRERGFPHAGDV